MTKPKIRTRRPPRKYTRVSLRTVRPEVIANIQTMAAAAGVSFNAMVASIVRQQARA